MTTILLSAWALPQPLYAQENDRKSRFNADAAANFAQSGMSFFQFIRGELRTPNQPSAPPFSSDDPKVIQADLTRLKDAYVKKVTQTGHLANAVSTFGNGTADLIAVGSIAATGGLSTPIVVAMALHRYANNEVSSALRDEGSKQAKEALGWGLKEYGLKNQLTPDQLVDLVRTKTTDDAKEKFVQDIARLNKLHGSLDKEPEAQAVVIRQLVESLADANAGLIQNARDSWKELTAQARAVKQFADETNASLIALEAKTDEISKSVKVTNERLDRLSDVTYQTSEQLSAVQAILFKNGSPSDKLLLLESGGVRGLTEDQSVALKAELEAQIKTQELISDSAKIVNYAQQFNKILSNLGIQDPKLAQAVSLASSIQSGFAALATGNYLDGIAAVSGIFAGAQPDPVQEGFNRVMGKLQEMDRKLTAILELQEATLEAIDNLSKQMADFDRRVAQRFDRTDFELARIADGLAVVSAEGLQSCNSLWAVDDPTTASGQWVFSDVPADQQNYSGLVRFLERDNFGDAIKCAEVLQKKLATLRSGSDVVGAPLSLSLAWRAANDDVPSTVLGKTRLGLLIEQHKGALRILRSAFPDQDPNLLYDLSSPAGSFAQDRSFPRALLQCPAGVDQCMVTPNQRRLLLDEPLVRDQIHYYAAWVARAARPLDLWKMDKVYYTIDELATTKRAARAPALFRSMLLFLDIAIAQQALLHGDRTAESVYQLAWNPRTSLPADKLPDEATGIAADANRLLHGPLNNEWLRRNVLSVALFASERSEDHAGAAANYERTLELLSAERPDLAGVDLWMRESFRLHDAVRFKLRPVGGSGVQKLTIVFPNGLEIDMPSASEFRERKVFFPDFVRYLIGLRVLFAERLADYEALPTDPTQLRRVSQTLMAAMAQKPPEKAIAK